MGNYKAHKSYKVKEQMGRLEKTALQILSGMCANPYYLNSTEVDLCQKSIDMANEFIQALDSQRLQELGVKDDDN